MNFLPVITRELQVQARQPATNRMRWIAAAVVMGIAGFLMMIGGHASPQERAKLIFISIGIVSLGFVMFAGVFQTADCLSEERREGTLGLLFLTDLKGYDVVLGKLASTSLHSVYTFLAIVPVLALPLLMGRMTVGEFWRVNLVLIAALYLSLGVGMFISAISREARGAMGGAFLVMLVLAGVMPVLWWVAVAGGRASGLKVLLWASPPYAFQRAFDNYYSMGPGRKEFWSCMVMMLGLGTAGLLAASHLLPRLWQEAGDRKSAKPVGRPVSWRLWSPGANFAKRKLRGEQPFFWLATRDGRPQRLAAWAFAILLPLWLYFFVEILSAKNQGPAIGFPLVLLMTYAMHVILKCLVAVEATRRFSEDRQSGALELLLVTPLPISEIIASQVRGVWHSFRWGYVILTLMNLALIWFLAQSEMFGRDSEAVGVFLLMMVGGIIVLYLDGYALVKVGMWMSLVKKRQAQAFLATVLRVLLPAWLLVVFFIFMGMAGAFSGGRNTFEGILFAWFFLGGLVALVGAARVSTNLEQSFREIASLGRVESRDETGGGPATGPTTGAT